MEKQIIEVTAQARISTELLMPASILILETPIMISISTLNENLIII
jgi:hypothetical protein